MKKHYLGTFLVVSALSILTSSSHGASIVYTATLTGPGETPPTTSPGVGFSIVTVDTTANTLRAQIIFSGLTSPTTMAHIHSPTPSPGTGTAIVATVMPAFPGFPIGVTSGTSDSTLDLTQASSYNPAYITAHGGTPASAEAALIASLAAGTAYLNIHTMANPGGEISGFLVPAAAVPEPTSVVLLGLGAMACMAGRAYFGRSRAA